MGRIADSTIRRALGLARHGWRKCRTCRMQLAALLLLLAAAAAQAQRSGDVPLPPRIDRPPPAAPSAGRDAPTPIIVTDPIARYYTPARAMPGAPESQMTDLSRRVAK